MGIRKSSKGDLKFNSNEFYGEFVEESKKDSTGICHL